MDYLVQSAADHFVIDIMSQQVESKWHMSQEAQWEIQGLQTYVAALAAHDLEHSTSPYLSAALDLPQGEAAIDGGNILVQDFLLRPTDTLFARSASAFTEKRLQMIRMTSQLHKLRFHFLTINDMAVVHNSVCHHLAGIGDEAKAAGQAGGAVLHDDAVGDVTKPLKVAAQALGCCLACQTSDKALAHLNL